MSQKITIDVDGEPAPQGSKTTRIYPNGRSVMFEDNPRTKPWRDIVRKAAKEQLPDGWIPFGGPVLLIARFALTPPAYLARVRERTWPDKQRGSDFDKLTRAICDAFTVAEVWGDDAQVVAGLPLKDFVGAPGFPDRPGVRITVLPFSVDIADVVIRFADLLAARQVPVQEALIL